MQVLQSPDAATQHRNHSTAALVLPEGDDAATYKLALDRIDALRYCVVTLAVSAPQEPGLMAMMVHLRGVETLSSRHAGIQAAPPPVAEGAAEQWHEDMRAFMQETLRLCEDVRPHVWDRIVTATDAQVGLPAWPKEDLFCLARLLERSAGATPLQQKAATAARALERVTEARITARGRLVCNTLELCDFTIEERDALVDFRDDPVVQQTLRVHQKREIETIAMLDEATEIRLRQDPGLSHVVALLENIWMNHHAASQKQQAKQAGMISYTEMRTALVAIAAENLEIAAAARDALRFAGWSAAEIDKIYSAVLSNPLKRIKPTVISNSGSPECMRFALPEDLLARAEDLCARLSVCKAPDVAEARDFSALEQTARELCAESTADNVLSQTLDWLTLSANNVRLRELGAALDQGERRLKALIKKGSRRGAAPKKSKAGAPKNRGDRASPSEMRVCVPETTIAGEVTTHAPDAIPPSPASQPSEPKRQGSSEPTALAPLIAAPDDRDLAAYVDAHMSAGTFGSRWSSAMYHYRKHGSVAAGAKPSMKAWLAEALEMRQQWDGHTVTRSFVDPSVLLRLVDNAATYLVFTQEGRIVSYRNRL